MGEAVFWEHGVKILYYKDELNFWRQKSLIHFFV